MDAACSVSLRPLPAPGALSPGTLRRSALPRWCMTQHMYTHAHTYSISDCPDGKTEAQSHAQSRSGWQRANGLGSWGKPFFEILFWTKKNLFNVSDELKTHQVLELFVQMDAPKEGQGQFPWPA